jgi:hypothetical protein
MDAVVTTRPAAWAGHEAPLVAVPLPALARRFDGDLPSGAIDAGSAVMTYGDQIGWVEEVDPDAAALESGVFHRDLIMWARATAPAPASQAPRVLVREDALVPLLRRALQALALDGSVVMTSPSVAEALERDPGRLERLRATERLTN